MGGWRAKRRLRGPGPASVGDVVALDRQPAQSACDLAGRIARPTLTVTRSPSVRSGRAGQAEVAEGGWNKELSAGAARGIRTPDPIITNDVLYRLSYCGARSGMRQLARLPAVPLRMIFV